MAVIDGTTGIDLVQDNAITTADVQNAAITAAKLSGAQTGSAPVYGCRAWCTFDGTLAGTNAPTAGGNVTSVTRNAAGDYTINFTTAMPDANYTVTALANINALATGIRSACVKDGRTTSAVGLYVVYVGTPTTGQDCSSIQVAIFR